MKVWPLRTGALCAKMARGLSGQDAFNETLVCIFRDSDTGNILWGGVSSTLTAHEAVEGADIVVEKHRKYIVRRLTPLECCRLQGFPDWWDADVEGSDSARYKMWGNGIALPCAADVLRRIAKELQQ